MTKQKGTHTGKENKWADIEERLNKMDIDIERRITTEDEKAEEHGTKLTLQNG